jgi:hypothetical protein
MVGLTAAVLIAAAAVGGLAFAQAARLGRVGADLTLYLGATRGWLGGGAFYPAPQLAGPYTITDGDILYPPSTIPLFAAFLVLPAVLFWLVPVAVTGWVVAWHRPAPWTWPLMALCLAYIPTTVKIVHGNPLMWATAAVALGTVYGWPAVFVLLKPSLAPFAAIGIRRRSWWVAAFGFGAVALAFAPLWPQYVAVLLDGRGGGLLYSLSDVPLLMIPIIASCADARTKGSYDAHRDGRECAPVAPRVDADRLRTTYCRGQLPDTDPISATAAQAP